MENQSTPPVLIEVTRGPAVESRHRGQIVVSDAQGKLLHQVGDPGVWVCLRSLAKPFQALAVLTSGAAAAFGFGAEELALFSGSPICCFKLPWASITTIWPRWRLSTAGPRVTSIKTGEVVWFSILFLNFN